MAESYIVYWRRNNKERYWQMKAGLDIWAFKNLLESFIEKTTEETLEIKIKISRQPLVVKVPAQIVTKTSAKISGVVS